MSKINMTVTEFHWNNAEQCEDYIIDVIPLKLPATDAGMVSAVELMDPFQCYPFSHQLGFMQPRAA